ncbi:ribbon-helix-helix protein, CopG family [Paraburkholderia strydomiana]|uniref:ribbon-helix-helix protein, CopG family n=1 Tax=Paraburkholderia strydomiana TaxID=1245417 RepID=UPI0038B8418C
MNATDTGRNVKKVRLNADLAPDVAQALEDLARTQGISLSEAVRRAISTESFLQRQRSAGSKVLLEEDGKLRELVFLR